MPLDNDISQKKPGTSIPDISSVFGTQDKRYVAVFFAAPSWGEESNYKAWSRREYDPGALRFIKEDELASIALFNPAKVELPSDCIAVALFEQGGRRLKFYMYGELISYQEGFSFEQNIAGCNGIELYPTSPSPYVKRDKKVAPVYPNTNLVLHPETRQVLWQPNQMGALKHNKS